MAFDQDLISLNYVLADLYPVTDETRRIVSSAGLSPAQIPFRPKAIDTWYEILTAAKTRGKLSELIQVALKDYPDNSVLIQAEMGGLKAVAGPGVDRTWKGGFPVDQLEKIMAKQSTLLPIAFLEAGLKCSRSVARVVLDEGTVGTGFLTNNNVLVTNHHVIEDAAQAKNATIQFNYQQTHTGLDIEPKTFQLDPDGGFLSSNEDDWTLVRTSGDANADWGAIPVDAVEIEKTRRVNIIQHPSGGPKQIALYHNVITFADDRRIQYLTDTLPGSSGSPVFDDQWRVVALHHSGGWLLEPGTKNHVFRNEGININLIAKALAQSGLN